MGHLQPLASSYPLFATSAATVLRSPLPYLFAHEQLVDGTCVPWTVYADVHLPVWHVALWQPLAWTAYALLAPARARSVPLAAGPLQHPVNPGLFLGTGSHVFR